MDLILIAIAPVAIIAFYVWYRDHYEREPLALVLKTMAAGVLIVLPVIVVENFLSRMGESLGGMLSVAYTAFIVAGFTEEFFKYLVLYFLIWKSRDFNDKYDGIVYATFVSLGFAGMENVMYVLQSGFSTGIMRAVTAVPAHAIFGITMGFYFGLAKFYVARQKEFKAKALWLPVVLHGIYDFILMTGIAWLWIVFAGFVIYLYVSGLRRMRILSVQSYYRTDYELLNRKFGGED
jgi:protease PrsW